MLSKESKFRDKAGSMIPFRGDSNIKQNGQCIIQVHMEMCKIRNEDKES